MKKTRSITRELAKLQGGKCYYCQDEIHFDEPNCPDRASFDHMILASEGGELTHDNGVASCRTCNSLRGDIHWLKWVSFIRSQIFRDCIRNIKKHRRNSLKEIKQLDEELEKARLRIDQLTQKRKQVVAPTKKAVSKYTKRILKAVA